MASLDASRARLQKRYLAILNSEKAIEKADDAYNGLWVRHDARRRRAYREEYGDSDEDDEEEEEDEDEDDSDDDSDDSKDEEGEKKHTKEDQKEDDDFADEEEEGFDVEVKSERLENERLQCQRKTIEACNEFVKNFEQCVKADNLSSLTGLYNTMCARLSIEVRNLIYMYLVEPDRQPVGFGGFAYCNPDFQSGEGIETDDALRKAQSAVRLGTYDFLKPGGWLLNPEYVGHGMARELAEMFYMVNDFAVSEAKFLPELLTLDRTETGLKPYEFVRRKFNVYIRTTYGNGDSERAWKTTENEVAYLNGVYNQLNTLNLITHKSQIDIEIEVCTSSPLWKEQIEGDRRFYNVMEAIRTPIYDLIHSGVKVTVNHKANSSYRTRNISGKDKLNYFAMGKDDWENERGTRAPDWLPSVNFISKEELEDDRNKDRVLKLLKDRWGHLTSIDAYGL